MNQTIRLDRHTWTKSLCPITGAEIYCPFATCSEVIADRWSVLILRDIAICNRRTFRSILANNVEKISSGVLAGRLKRLTDIGLLYFKDDPEHSQRKIYCLSPAAIDLVPILLDMSAWAMKHTSPSKEPIAPPSSMDRPQSQYSKELTDRLRSVHLDPSSATACPT
jgi:DNA-binding HxlR family transcriptional regulator